MNSIDPVRLFFIEALARRAELQSGDVRNLLDARLATLRAATDPDPLQERTPDGAAAGPAVCDPRSPLSELVESLARRGSPNDGTSAVDGGAFTAATPPEIEALDYFRRTWSRLSADRRLVQSMAAVPENPGPLNSHRLVHRSLALMRELSPGYLHRFMSHVDTLLWLDRMNAGSPDGGAAGSTAARAKGAKKTTRAKKSG